MIKNPKISERLNTIFNQLGIVYISTLDMDYLDVDESKNMITFITTKNIKISKDPWKYGRNKIKIGKFLNLYLKLESIVLEYLVNQYKTLYDLNNHNFDIFSIVKGDDIWKYYQIENYSISNGSLKTSCMSNASKEQLKFYTDNKDTIHLLIIKDNMNKIVSRALMWKLEDGTYYIDRPYTINNIYNNYYQEYVKYNKYKYYFNNKNNRMKVIVKKNRYNNLPYLDTFKIVNNIINGEITNN